jgi:hypothetical protein
MNNASRIGIIGSGGTPCLINTPTVPSNPAGIVVAPGGHVWITEFTAGKIGKVSQGTTCAQDGIAEFPIPTAKQRTGANRTGSRRQSMVHRICRQQDRPYYDHRHDHRISIARGQQPALGDQRIL